MIRNINNMTQDEYRRWIKSGQAMQDFVVLSQKNKELSTTIDQQKTDAEMKQNVLLAELTIAMVAIQLEQYNSIAEMTMVLAGMMGGFI